MLVHCSGGMDRTAPIVAFIASKSVGACPFV
jgi:protein-tyrosine phosphatase